MTKSIPWLGIAAVLGFLNVCFGAFAAHGVTDPKAAEWLRTGAQYGFIHCLAVFAAAFAAAQGHRLARCAQLAFIGGAVIFPGTLYAMALGAPHILGAITPIGGGFFLVGWAILAVACFRKPS